MSVEIPLGNGMVAVIDDDDAVLAERYTWHFKPHFSNGLGYARTTVRNGTQNNHYVLHRLVLRARPYEIIDHINRDPLDNRKVNLRFCTTSQNTANRKPARGSSMPYRGLTIRGAHYVALASKGRKQYFGPRRVEAVDAARDYDKLARELHGHFAILNFPESAT